MSFRWRLALLLAGLAALGIGAVATVSYVATARAVRGDTDAILDRQANQAVASLSRINRGPATRLGPQGERGPGRPGGGLLGAADLPDFLRVDTVVQLLDTDGTVLYAFSRVALPVDERDLALATDAGGGVLRRNVDIDGVTYRMRTSSLPDGALQVARNIDGTADVLARLRNRFGLLAVLSTVVAAVIGWAIATRVTSPLSKLTAAAESVTASGRLDTSIDLGVRDHDSRDETSRLAASFTTMLAALSQSRDQQRKLVQDAGHELRTPLTSVRTNVEVLRRHRGLPEETRDKILGDIDTEVGELASLVDELVQLATGEQDGAEAVTPVRLDELAAQVVDRAMRRSGRVIELVATPTVVNARTASLERAITNLVGNAVKFSPEGAPVQVLVTGGRVEVRDRGPGIPPADLERVFDRFYRADVARSAPGSGLGLAIVAQTARTHGGRVFASNLEGGGASVGFEIPLLESPHSADRLPD